MKGTYYRRIYFPNNANPAYCLITMSSLFIDTLYQSPEGRTDRLADRRQRDEEVTTPGPVLLCSVRMCEPLCLCNMNFRYIFTIYEFTFFRYGHLRAGSAKFKSKNRGPLSKIRALPICHVTYTKPYSLLRIWREVQFIYLTKCQA